MELEKGQADPGPAKILKDCELRPIGVRVDRMPSSRPSLRSWRSQQQMRLAVVEGMEQKRKRRRMGQTMS